MASRAAHNSGFPCHLQITGYATEHSEAKGSSSMIENLLRSHRAAQNFLFWQHRDSADRFQHTRPSFPLEAHTPLLHTDAAGAGFCGAQHAMNQACS